MFITYLSRGRPKERTPTTMKARLDFDKYPNKGEAGRRLEALIFGGTMDYLVDPDTGTGWDEVFTYGGSGPRPVCWERS